MSGVWRKEDSAPETLRAQPCDQALFVSGSRSPAELMARSVVDHAGLEPATVSLQYDLGSSGFRFNLRGLRFQRDRRRYLRLRFGLRFPIS